jgi:hypothetical protein
VKIQTWEGGVLKMSVTAMKKNHQPPPEAKRAKFRRLAEFRVRKAIGYVRSVGKLGRSDYESTQAERDTISSALVDAVDAAMRHLNGAKKETFTL